MGRREFKQHVLVRDVDLNGGFTSEVTHTKMVDNIGYQLSWGTNSTFTGTVAIQTSSATDEDIKNYPALDVWDDLPLGATPTITGSNASFSFNINQFPFERIRLMVTETVAGALPATLMITIRSVGA